MIMSWVFTFLVAISLLCSALLGNGATLSAAVMEGAQAGITLAISLAGSILLWSGVGVVMDKAGLTTLLSRLIYPITKRVFPSVRRDKQLGQHLSANICANFLGLGNAATPMGIRAAKRLVNPATPTVATDELCRLIVLNTASIQLIPANVAAVRSGLGAASPFDILPAVWITSLCSAGLGLVAAWLMGRICRHA